ncbi:YncE family protein [Halorubrum trueperi]|uniref:YncE family protein n=1 Tax=Halorubrum trueperi TaxID=2004704 RepID=A0ABD5UKB9_9EURY
MTADDGGPTPSGNRVGDSPTPSKDRVGDSPTPPGGRVVAVPCEGANVLALFALDTGEPLGEVPVGSHPVHATAHRGGTFVATMGERAVTAVAPDGEVVRIETGVLGPSHFAVANGDLFISCSAGDALAVIDPERLTLLDRIGVGAEPHEVAVSTDGRRLYAGSRRDGVVDVVDPAARERIGSIPIGANARVQGVAIAPDGSRGYAVDQRGARVVAFDTGRGRGGGGDAAEDGTRDAGSPATDAVVADAPVGADPYDLVATADRVFVPGRDDGTVHEFDPDLERVAIHDGFSRPVDLFELGSDRWVLDAGAARLRSLGGEAIETPAPGLVATRVDPGDRPARLVVSHYDDDLLSLVDVESGTVWTVETPAYPFGTAIV